MRSPPQEPYRPSPTTPEARAPASGWQTFGMVLVAVFACEAVIMSFLPSLALGLDDAWIAVLDSLLLSLLVSPFLWFVLVRPIHRHSEIERRRVERELAFQHYTLDQHAIVAMTDPAGVITYVNDRFCERSGYTREELIGQSHRTVRSGEHPPSFFTDLWAKLRRGEVWQGEICNQAKDGTHYWLESTIVPFRGDSGEIERYVAIRTDITPLKHAEDQLRLRAVELQQARDAAEAATRAKSEFLAVMSHEIRTPMNGILGMAELLRAGALPDDEREWVRIILSSSHLLLAVVNDVLDFSKIEAGHLSLEELPLDLRELINDLLLLLAQQAGEKQIDLSLRSPWPELPALLLGDPGRLRQILLNLLTNALKFTERGHVHVKVERLDAAEPGAGPAVRICVEDTGIGVPLEAQARVFDSFTQASSSTTRRFGGTGLGLAICKRLSKMMGGAIGLKSTPGEGSTFWFTIPLRAAESPLASAAMPTPLGSSVGLSRRVLVADDVRVNRLVTSRLLESLGCEVQLAVDGLEAVGMCAESPFDLVFMDCEMPRLNGFQAAAQIREQQGACSRPVLVALTASALRGDRERCLASGMDDYMSKPISREAIRSVLARWPPSSARQAGEASAP